MKRRRFLAGVLAAGCAPAIVRASSIMVLPPQRIITDLYALGSDKLGEMWLVGSIHTGRINIEGPNFQEIPKNWPIQGHAVQMQMLIDKKVKQRRLLMAEGESALLRAERRLMRSM